MSDKIIIRGAREHNLKNINLELPRNKLIVFTGLSGSGKSSLAFDTIFAEGQRRYVESLSAYARQFLGQMDKPDVDEIEGLSPAISIDQKAHSANPRSTVATITEIYDYLRVLFARVGKPHCVVCGKEIRKLSIDEMVNIVLARLARPKERTEGGHIEANLGAIEANLGAKLPLGSLAPKFASNSVAPKSASNGSLASLDLRGSLRSAFAREHILVLSPVVRGRKGEYYQLLYDLYNDGFAEVRIDDKIKKLKGRIILSRYKTHNIDLVVDRVPLGYPIRGNKALRSHLAEAIETGQKYGRGVVTIVSPSTSNVDGDITMSSKFSCPDDGFSFSEIEPRLFSFNSPYGACPKCHGLGAESTPLFITSRSFGGESGGSCPECGGKRLKKEALNVFIGGKNICDITAMNIKEAYNFIISNPSPFAQRVRDGASVTNEEAPHRRRFPVSNQNFRTKYEQEQIVAEPVIREIANRLKFMLDVGLDYLTLDRKTGTLSGGEAQRIRLASQVGSRLVGALYVLDEPTIGLHQRDNEKLLSTLKELRDLGNTVIVVEHDENTILASDYLVDLGPGAGKQGGEIVTAGNINKLLASDGKAKSCQTQTQTQTQIREFHSLVYETTSKTMSIGGEDDIRAVRKGKDPIIGKPDESLTLQYLSGKKENPIPETRRKNNKDALKIIGAKANNLKNINVEIPLRRLVCVTGVSGSGKSTLVQEVLYKELLKPRFAKNYRSEDSVISGRTEKCRKILGREYLDKVVVVDQSPIGRTPRSNPATYVGAFTHIRELFALTPEARMRGYKINRFSFNRPGGRCEHCEGNGTLAVEMHFLPTVYIKCDVCKEKRFNQETLEVKYKNKNIAEVLQMTIEEADEFFKDIPAIHDKFKILREVGLGYLELGQGAPTLSGGEAQRVKLSRELAKYQGLCFRSNHSRTLYLLDEPTVGLHFEDIKNLIDALQKLVFAGNSVIIIEHNLDIIKSADYIIDLGPEGGDKGGEVVVAGAPEEVALCENSYTGKYLRKILNPK